MSKEFGSRVRQARKNAGMTQAELAEKMNLDTTTISRIENGNLSTSFSSMLNFSKVLNVRFEYLICDYLEELKHAFAEVVDEYEGEEAYEETMDILTGALDAMEDAFDGIEEVVMSEL